jgi:hypothetical protein
MKDHWAAMLAVAAELLKRSKLTAAEVEAIVRSVLPEIRLQKSKA